MSRFLVAFVCLGLISKSYAETDKRSLFTPKRASVSPFQRENVRSSPLSSRTAIGGSATGIEGTSGFHSVAGGAHYPEIIEVHAPKPEGRPRPIAPQLLIIQHQEARDERNQILSERDRLLVDIAAAKIVLARGEALKKEFEETLKKGESKISSDALAKVEKSNAELAAEIKAKRDRVKELQDRFSASFEPAAPKPSAESSIGEEEEIAKPEPIVITGRDASDPKAKLFRQRKGLIATNEALTIVLEKRHTHLLELEAQLEQEDLSQLNRRLISRALEQVRANSDKLVKQIESNKTRIKQLEQPTVMQ